MSHKPESEIMVYAEYIESLLDGADKKVHAGEWLRVETVRCLLSDLCLKMLEDQKVELNELKRGILSNSLFRGEEE
tara:strand:+ start:4121 stop:4348 length:228 start_codon:yes stop_codon:yes gene_type:complete